MVALALPLLASACKEKEPPPPDKPVAAAPVRPADPLAADSFRVRVVTSKGAFVIELKRAWSPLGVDRFNRLVAEGFFNDGRFFRVMKGFVAQFGMSGDPAVGQTWKDMTILDEAVVQSNKRGTITFAIGGANTRSTQFFINLADNLRLDAMGFSPIGKVVEGMSVVDALYSGYGDGPPEGTGPNQGLIESQGNAYLKKTYPKLDYIKSVTVVGAAAAAK